MGIPKYFRYITTTFDSLLLKTNDTKVKIANLYFDMNCMIHPCVRNVTSNYPALVKEYNTLENSNKFQNDSTLITNFESKVYKEIDDYLDKLIATVLPTQLIYLAIDGVAPRAKMEQQRVRRYRTVKQKKLEEVIYNKHTVNKIDFDTNCITPGTIFMFKLSVHLKKYINDKYKELNINLILDDSQNKGEGEHKIIQYIKKYTSDEVNCIYGLDADLIMLSLCANSDIYLLRETVHFGKVYTDSFLYFDVRSFGEQLFNNISTRINENLDESVELDKQTIINDYVCLCFLIGNDFLPHINGIDISNNSINDLLKTYIEIYKVRLKPLTDNCAINFIFLRQILTNLYSNEHLYLPKYQSKIDYFSPKLNYSSEMELEIEKIRLYPIYNKNTYLKLGKEDWINKYYKYYFNIDNITKNADFINDICSNYIDGLQWNIKYYLDNCPCYSWYYKYRATPCLRELCKHLLLRVYPTNFEDENDFTPLEQLAIVLPIQSSKLWCQSYKNYINKDIKLSGYYPADIKLDTLNKKFLYECNPILMDIDHNYIKTIFNDITLTPFELERSIKSDLYMVGFQENENIIIEVK